MSWVTLSKGIQVAVVDTGIDYKHPLLKDNYKGGYDAVDKDNDPYETEPDPTKPPKGTSSYDTSHGTHVSGTILDIAPEADLYVYRVLGPYGSGTTADVIVYIERAVQDGADVINLSLGSSMNQSYSADSIAIDNAVKSGVDVIIARRVLGRTNRRSAPLAAHSWRLRSAPPLFRSPFLSLILVISKISLA